MALEAAKMDENWEKNRIKKNISVEKEETEMEKNECAKWYASSFFVMHKATREKDHKCAYRAPLPNGVNERRRTANARNVISFAKKMRTLRVK